MDHNEKEHNCIQNKTTIKKRYIKMESAPMPSIFLKKRKKERKKIIDTPVNLKYLALVTLFSFSDGIDVVHLLRGILFQR